MASSCHAQLLVDTQLGGRAEPGAGKITDACGGTPAQGGSRKTVSDEVRRPVAAVTTAQGALDAGGGAVHPFDELLALEYR
jgi:hypothetical protein